MSKPGFDYRRGFTNDQDVPHGAPTDHKAPYIDYGTTIYPAEPYYSREAMDREWKAFWPRVWTMAGRASDCAKVGEFFTYQIGRENFIIVRSATDRVQAFYNVCQHRGNRLVHKDHGCAQHLTCGFHSWSYHLDGMPARITDEETFRPEVICDRNKLSLSAVRCEIWGGFVFINMDPDAAPLKNFIGDLDAHFAPFKLEKWTIQSDAQMEWNANWKTGVDAFIELYHSHQVHRELEQHVEAKICQQDCYSNGHSRTIVPFGLVSHRIQQRPKALNDVLQYMLKAFEVDPEQYSGPVDNIRAELIRAKRAWGKKYGLSYIDRLSDWQMVNLGSYHVFPNFTINVLPETVLVQRWRPHRNDPEKLTYDVITLLPPVKDASAQLRTFADEGRTDNVIRMTADKPARPERVYTQDAPQLGFILNQDYYAIPKVQEGLRSAGFNGMRFSEQEVRLRHFREQINRYLDDPDYMRDGPAVDLSITRNLK